MKKILFIAVAATSLLLNSCSSSSVGEKSSLSFKLDGVAKTLKVLPNRDGGELFPYGYTGNVNNPTEVVEFVTEIGETGTYQTSMFYYLNPQGQEYVPVTSLTFNITSSTETETIGTFSGTLHPSGGGTTIALTDGAFTLKY